MESFSVKMLCDLWCELFWCCDTIWIKIKSGGKLEMSDEGLIVIKHLRIKLGDIQVSENCISLKLFTATW